MRSGRKRTPHERAPLGDASGPLSGIIHESEDLPGVLEGVSRRGAALRHADGVGSSRSRQGGDQGRGRSSARWSTGATKSSAILGKGGMGTVYACRHVVVGKTFALKVLRPGNEQTGAVLAPLHPRGADRRSVRAATSCEMTDFGQLPDGSSTCDGAARGDGPRQGPAQARRCARASCCTCSLQPRTCWSSPTTRASSTAISSRTTSSSWTRRETRSS
jgi:hypothetical protein